MRRHPWLIDLTIAAVVAIIALVISPGMAITGIVALAVLLICTVSLLVGTRRRRRAR